MEALAELVVGEGLIRIGFRGGGGRFDGVLEGVEGGGRVVGVESEAAGILEVLAGFLLEGGFGDLAEALEPWLLGVGVAVGVGEVEAGGDELDEIVEEEGVIFD